MVPVKDLSQRELLSRVRALIDRVADPEHRVRNPETFAQDYHLLILLATTHSKKLDGAYFTHNLGEQRMRFLREVLEQHDKLGVIA